MAGRHDRSSRLSAQASRMRARRIDAATARPAPAVAAHESGSVDVLSDVLRNVRLTGAVFFPMDASSPWVDEIPAASEFAPLVLPGAQHVVSYHIVRQGGCWAALCGETPVRLEAGDVFVVPTATPTQWRVPRICPPRCPARRCSSSSR